MHSKYSDEDPKEPASVLMTQQQDENMLDAIIDAQKTLALEIRELAEQMRKLAVNKAENETAREMPYQINKATQKDYVYESHRQQHPYNKVTPWLKRNFKPRQRYNNRQYLGAHNYNRMNVSDFKNKYNQQYNSHNQKN
jgi:hypothetical protein